MTRVLLLSTTTGYQLRSFNDAAEQLGIELVFATDRCQQLDDPWRDRAIPGSLSRGRLLDRGDRRRRPAHTVPWGARGGGPSRRSWRPAWPRVSGFQAMPPTRPPPQQQARDAASPRGGAAGRSALLHAARGRRRRARGRRRPHRVSLRPQAAGVIGESRRHPRGFAPGVCRRVRSHLGAARAGRRARGQDRPREHRPRRTLPSRPRARRRGCVDHRIAAGLCHLRQARPARRSILRRDDLRDAHVAWSGKRAATGHDDPAGQRRARDSGTGPFTPSAAGVRTVSSCSKSPRGRSVGCVPGCCGLPMAPRSSTYCCATRSARTCRPRRARQPRRR